MQQKLYATLIAAGLLAGQAGATLITFDDLPDPRDHYLTSDPIPAGYAGYSWITPSAIGTKDNFCYLNGHAISGTGYEHGIVSGNNVAFNRSGFIATFGGGGLFTLDSAYFTSAWYDNQVVTISGYSGSTLKFTKSFATVTSAPTLVTFGWSGIDSFTMSSSYNNSPIVMDNLNIAVPEPTTMIAGTLLLLPFGASTLRMLRGRRAV